MIAIDVHNLSKSFGSHRAVDNVTLQVAAGTICGFLGPNGSGKTTTIRMLCGLLSPDGGSGTCLDLDIRTQSEKIRRNAGYMTQRFSLYEDLTIRENLLFVARLYELDRAAARVDAALDELGLSDRARQLAGTLSGGWRQRLALAACVLHEPKLLLLDEPTAGVDPKARRDFWGQIHELADRGVTILVSTHYMDEAERCHEIAYIANGHLIAKGTMQDIIGKSGLHAFWVEGPHLANLARTLIGLPGIALVATFGARLHVCGTDLNQLRHALHPYREDPRYRWQEAEASLEDVFIHLLNETGESRP
ncbi:MAG TPA: ABC transporter ATP-binding protein [Dongiaceae bacterium]|jgi:ABC-2 type transport system ATP-binding protein|nr:ABC transporter ATP-binding protein [Dongiaceae bacterium]